MPSEPGTAGSTSEWLQPSQSAPTHWGYVGADATSHGTGAPSNGDGGSDLATADQVDALHGRFDQLQEQVGGLASSGQQGNSNLQQLTPARMPERPRQVSPSAASAAQRDAAGEQMQQANQQLQATKASTSAHFAARQASFNGIAPPNTTNAISAGHAEVSFNGNFGSGIGSAPSTWNVQKWQSRQ